MEPLDVVHVDDSNVDETSFFCLQSRPDSTGYQRKRAWLRDRFAEGLRIRMLGRRDRRKWQGERGFVEYIPGSHAWRAVEADGYLFVHCLWVVGKSRGKGGATTLLDVCMEDAEQGGYAGVATVAAENGYATTRRFWERHGFEAVAESDPKMALMVRRLDDDAPPPRLSAGALRGPAHYAEGLTILRSDQCPYLDEATEHMAADARELGVDRVEVVELRSAAEVRTESPTPYGVFAAVLDGQLLGYRYLTTKELTKAVARVRGDA